MYLQLYRWFDHEWSCGDLQQDKVNLLLKKMFWINMAVISKAVAEK